MNSAVALKILHDVQIDDLMLETIEGRKPRLRCVPRLSTEQVEIIAALGLSLPERICVDCDDTPQE